MDDKLKEAIEFHTAGAIIRHNSQFDSLESYRNNYKLSQEFLDEWVKPYYLKIGEYSHELVDVLKLKKDKITPEIIQKNLGDFNWRTRQTGAFFAAITNQTQFIDIIGTHLLKSEVCYAGQIYCDVLAFFNTTSCIDYLNAYLDNYLAKPELEFDQKYAIEAIKYLDKINHTSNFEKHLKKWNYFSQNLNDSYKKILLDRIEKHIEVLATIKNF